MLKKANTPFLETERLFLRKFSENDLQDIFLIYSDHEVNRFLPWYPLETMEEAREYLKKDILPEYEKPIAYRYAIEEKATSRVIGYVSLCDIHIEKCCADLGYGLLKTYWNKGIITEAASTVLETAKENGFARITATHDVNNPASGAVMQKVGMTFRYSYVEQWQPKNFKVIFRLYQIDF